MLGQVNFNDLFHSIEKERIIWFRKKFQKDIVHFHGEFCNWIILHDKGFNDVKIFHRNFLGVIFTFSLNQFGDDVIHLFSFLVSSFSFIPDVCSRACWFVLAWNKKTGISFVLLWFYDVRQREEIYQKSIAQFKQKNTFYLVYNIRAYAYDNERTLTEKHKTTITKGKFVVFAVSKYDANPCKIPWNVSPVLLKL